MDRKAATTQMKALFNKAKAARTEGKRKSAATFRSGAQRLQRKIAIDLRRNPPVEKKDDAADQ